MTYRNAEGYADPTAGEALAAIKKEERQKENDAKHRRRIYVASPYAGDTVNNKDKAIRYCRFVLEQGYMPIASHLLYPAILLEEVPEERFLGTMFGLTLLRFCDEVWVFGKVSPGMKKEISEARYRGKPVKYFDEDCREV